MITTVNELGSVLSQVTPTASAMNVSFEQVGAALANMTAQGTPTAQATTQLNQLFAELGKKGTAGQQALEAAAEGTKYAGKSFQDLMKDGVPLNELIDMMSVYAENNGLSMIDMFSSIESGKAALAISGQNSKQFADNLKEMGTEADLVGDAYAKVTDTFKEKSNIVVNSLKNVGIQAYEKFEVPLKGAMDAAQKSVDELSKDMASGKLGNSVDTIAEGFGSLVEVASNLAADVLPVVINGFAFMIDHGKELGVALSGVAGAMVAIKTKNKLDIIIPRLSKSFQAASRVVDDFVLGQQIAFSVGTKLNTGLTLQQAIVGVLTGKIKATAAANAVWNAVQSANPVMMVVAGTAALVAAMGSLLYISTESVRSARAKNDAAHEEVASMKELSDARRDAQSDAVSEIDNYTKLKDELKLITDENGKVKEGYEKRAAFIVDTLSQATGLEIEMVDGVIQKYQEQMSTMDELIAKQRAKAIIDAGADAYNEALGNQTAAIQAVKAAEQEHLDAKTALHKEIDELVKTGMSIDDAMLQAEMGNAGERVRIAEDTLAQKKATMEGYTDIIAEQTYLQELYASGNAEDIAAINDYVAASYDENGKRVVLSLEDRIDNEDRLMAYLNQKYNDTHLEMYKSQLTQAENRKKNLQDELDTQKSTIEAKTPDIVAAFSQMSIRGVRATEQGDAMAATADGNVNAYANKLGADSDGKVRLAGGMLAKEGIKGADEEKPNWNTSGDNGATGYSDGLTGIKALGLVGRAGAKLARWAIDAANKEQDAHSPARVWRDEVGYMAGAGFAVGLDNAQGIVCDAAKDMVRSSLDVGLEEADGYASSINDIFKGMNDEEIKKIGAKFVSDYQAIAYTVPPAIKIQADYELQKIKQLYGTSNETQTQKPVTIQQTVQFMNKTESPSETYRALQRANKKLANML